MWARLRGGEITPRRMALSVAVGLAVGVTPLWGVHWLILLAVCVPCRLDTGVALLASQVSLPFLAPFVTLAELQLGSRILFGHWVSLRVEELRGIPLRTWMTELLVGTAFLATWLALAGGALAYGVTWAMQRRRT